VPGGGKGKGGKGERAKKGKPLQNLIVIAVLKVHGRIQRR
jgi:hypothetical protein